MENVEQKSLEYGWGIAPSLKIESLEATESERVFHIIENKTVLARLCPFVEPVFEFANDLGEVRDRALLAIEHVHTLNPRIELAFLFEVQAIAVALDQDAKQREKELQVLADGF